MAMNSVMARSDSRLVRVSSKGKKGGGGLLKNQLELVKRKDCDRYTIAKIPENLSFEKGFYMFIRACQLLAQNNEGISVVGLAGPSGAGKTVFCDKVLNCMPGIASISMDNYNDASRLVDGNFDDPALTDYGTLLQNILDLKDGKPVKIPVYDFKLSCRTGYRDVDVPSSRIVIIEGIHALNEQLRPLLDLCVSVTGGVHFDLVKRVLRDIGRCGQEPAEIIAQISETVYPMYKVHIEPQLETAHIKIINKFNPFSGFQTPTYILKSSRVVTEDQIREVLSIEDPGKTEETYDIYLLPPGEDPETCQSYLRMRSREGKYNLMFEQEWVTDHPFIISPRITFEVGVRLLGGLMALGYTITSSLKRTSRIFTDDRVIVKVDKLEQLHRKYIQVQGKDRSFVAEVAQKLGLDGSYVPRSYIEQIQLEKLTAEIMEIPDDLKSKLLQNDSEVASPRSFSWISEAKPGLKNQYSKSWSRNSSNDMCIREDYDHPDRPQKTSSKSPLSWEKVNSKKYDNGVPDSPREIQDQDYGRLAEQMAGVSERLDEVLSRVSELETKLPQCGSQGHLPRQGSAVGSFGNSLGVVNCNGNPSGSGSSPPITASNGSGPGLDSSVVEEVRNLVRGQRHLTKQLDLLSKLLRESIDSPSDNKKNDKWKWESHFGRMRTNDSGLAIVATLVTIGIGGVIGMIVLRTSRT
ncbi:inorganic pyrophosphatase TTM1 isoform X1 [Cryptomeria japonica]|uniref:inorganic pyrophosphatase TTM1 isoform X1 n=1 Tax=Cryptomeria japonica TaxID=3369 RepID=UPI0025AD760C|nr:inorganic pyrophosphatase TTM1 isoform X1 [Cryptomeria japonica]